MSGFHMIAGGGDNCAHETIVQTGIWCWNC